MWFGHGFGRLGRQGHLSVSSAIGKAAWVDRVKAGVPDHIVGITRSLLRDAGCSVSGWLAWQDCIASILLAIADCGITG